MQLYHSGERGELRVLVDERGVEPLRRRRPERIPERNLLEGFEQTLHALETRLPRLLIGKRDERGSIEQE